MASESKLGSILERFSKKYPLSKNTIKFLSKSHLTIEKIASSKEIAGEDSTPKYEDDRIELNKGKNENSAKFNFHEKGSQSKNSK
jgi:hypothetical protein